MTHLLLWLLLYPLVAACELWIRSQVSNADPGRMSQAQVRIYAGGAAIMFALSLPEPYTMLGYLACAVAGCIAVVHYSNISVVTESEHV